MPVARLEEPKQRLLETVIRERPEQVAPLLAHRELGLLRGKVWFADDFDAPLPDDIQKYFDGSVDL